MNFGLVSTAFAQGTQAAPRSGGAPLWPMLIAMFVIFYFFLIRPQQKRQKEAQNMMNSLAKGDRVVTIGGIHGTIVSIRKAGEKPDGDDIVILKVSDATKLEMLRSSIARVLSKEGESSKETTVKE